MSGYSTFLEIGCLPLPQSLTVGFYRFQIHTVHFLIFRKISVTRQFLVPLTSIETTEVNGTRNCLVTDIFHWPLFNQKPKKTHDFRTLEPEVLTHFQVSAYKNGHLCTPLWQWIDVHLAICLERYISITTVLCETLLSLDICGGTVTKGKDETITFSNSPSGRKRLSYFAVEPQAVHREGRIKRLSLSQTAACSATRWFLVGRGWKLLLAFLSLLENVISWALMHMSHFPLPVPLSLCVYQRETAAEFKWDFLLLVAYAC